MVAALFEVAVGGGICALTHRQQFKFGKGNIVPTAQFGRRIEAGWDHCGIDLADFGTHYLYLNLFRGNTLSQSGSFSDCRQLRWVGQTDQIAGQILASQGSIVFSLNGDLPRSASVTAGLYTRGPPAENFLANYQHN